MPEIQQSSAPTRSRRRAFALGIPLVVGALALAMGWALSATVPAAALPERTAAGQVATTPRVALVLAPVTAPAPVQPPPPAPAPAPAPIAGPTWSISIATVGLQAEIDACQWVRMDFTDEVPLPVVAAHNFCGGGIVLDMQDGDTVALSGTGLDGLYVVSGSKDATADDDATDAIAGLSGDVVLQTCYWANDGSERLVALTRVG
ncbi:MAG: hypothetical protein ABJA94_09895 [Rhodoglobus sp.]